MKAGRGIELPQATKIFTDREEPRAAFHKLYDRCVEEIGRGEANVHVLTYYGIGGIGKTTLLKKLREELAEQHKGARFVHFDLRYQQERIAVMDAIKNLLAEQYRFSFPLYELGCYFYLRKVGANPDAPEIRRLSDQSPLLKAAFTILDKIPVVEIGAKVLEALDAGVAGVRSYFANHPKELRDIKYMEPEKLYDHLPLLFAQDLNENLKNAKAPLVLFLDTYEQLVNELSAMGDPLLNDLWLRGMTSLVPNAINTLWVIAGREMLRWREINEDWADALEQHNLGNLSPLDSERFLAGASVEGPDLRAGLYHLTGGTPVYLDLCVDQYHQMLKQGETPRLSSFGTDTRELTERYSRYLDDGQKDLVQMLACLKRWTDEQLEQLAPQVLPNFSYSTYEKLKTVSFIDRNAAGVYTMHQTVCEVLSQQCPLALRQKLGQAMLDTAKEPEQRPSILDPAYTEELAQKMAAAILGYPDREALCTYYRKQLQYPLEQLAKAGRPTQAQNILMQLWEVAKTDPTDRLYAILLTDRAFHMSIGEQRVENYLPLAEEAYRLCKQLLGDSHPDTLRALSMLAVALRIKGDHKQAMELHQLALELRTQALGPDHLDVLSSRYNIGLIYSATGYYEKALEQYDLVLEGRKKKLGEDHPRTLSIMNSIANTLSSMHRYPEVLTMRTHIYQKQKEIHGEDHLATISALISLANVYSDLGRNEEALPLHRAVYEKRKEILGEDHSHTLRALNNLANTLDDLDRNEEALPLHQTVFEKRREILGENSLETLRAMGTLAYALATLNRKEEALELRIALVKRRKAVLGEDHAETLRAMNNLAGTYDELKRHEEALPLRQTVLEKRRALFGEDHTDTIWSVSSLAGTLEYLGRKEEALELRQTVFEKRKELHGEDHPDTLKAMGNLAGTYDELGRFEEAIELYTALLEKRRAIHGDTHPDTLRTTTNLACTLYSQGRYEEAGRHYRTVLEHRNAVLGESHTKTISALHNLICALERSGQIAEAAVLSARRLAILQQKGLDTATEQRRIARLQKKLP